MKLIIDFETIIDAIFYILIMDITTPIMKFLQKKKKNSHSKGSNTALNA